MKPDLVVQTELARSVHKSEGFVCSSMDRVTLLVNSLLYGITIFKDFDENELSSNIKIHDFRQCFDVKSLLSGFKVSENKAEQKIYPASTRSKAKTITT